MRVDRTLVRSCARRQDDGASRALMHNSKYAEQIDRCVSAPCNRSRAVAPAHRSRHRNKKIRKGDDAMAVMARPDVAGSQKTATNPTHHLTASK